MSTYRNDLDAAKLRITDLEEQLARRARPRPAKKRKSRGNSVTIQRISFFTVLVALVIGLFWTCAQREPSVARTAMPQTTTETVVGRPPPTTRARPPPAREAAAVGIPMKCDPHVYASLAELPSNSHVIDFEECIGCACCRTPTGDSNDCRNCSKEQALARAGLTTAGVSTRTPRGLRAAGRKISLTFPHAVSIFAATTRPTYMGGDGVDSVTMIARDENGDLVDTDTSDYPAGPAGTDANAHRFLVVRACHGTGIHTVDVEFTQYSMVITNLAYYPP